MKNKEKFAKEIIDLAIKNETVAVDKYTHEVVPCDGFECCNCLLNSVDGYCDNNRPKWAEEEYVEPPIDWSKVPVDTPILVSDDDDTWYKRYFSKYENEKIYAWSDGCTSWSACNKDYVTKWRYAKLAETEDNE